MSEDKAALISGDTLKQAAGQCAAALHDKIAGEQKGFFSIFDKWFTQVLTRFLQFDRAKTWEQSVAEEIARAPGAATLAWDLLRLRMFLDRWRQGRLIEFAQREADAAHYYPRFGTEFSIDVFLTAQGAPSLMQWRGVPLMKTVFDFALYPMLLAELRPRTIFEIGSGLGASALWLADHLSLLGVDAYVHSVDLNPPVTAHAGVTFYRGDCHTPETLFPREILQNAPHPWLAIEDAHINVEAVLNTFHAFLIPDDYLVVEDSEVKREALRAFIGAHPGAYKVDTRYTDYFGRNATCAEDSIFRRVGQ
jgi:cephalosporin hydroxylase